MNASIEMQLFHLKKKGEHFNPDTFYRAILTGDGDDYNEQVGLGYRLPVQFRVGVRVGLSLYSSILRIVLMNAAVFG